MIKSCTIGGCDTKLKAKGLCAKHWSQMKRRGKIIEHNRLSDNEIRVYNDYMEILLYNTLGLEVGRAIVDKSCLEDVKKHKWYLNNSGYAITRVSRSEQLLLHKLLLKTSEGMVVDHIDGNTLNNRRNNLRECTQQQNLMNQKTSSDNTSGYKGVNWCKRKNRWRARIQLNGKDIHLGFFDTIEAATAARAEGELKHFGEYSRKKSEGEK